MHWLRSPERAWERRIAERLDAVVEAPDLGVSLPLAAIHDGVSFAPRPRLVGEPGR